jgi:hypothetical protein
MRPILTLLFLLFLLFLLVLAGPVLAVDGVLEINQTCVVHTGCFAGDYVGFPVAITGVAGRSDRLTSDLISCRIKTPMASKWVHRVSASI